MKIENGVFDFHGELTTIIILKRQYSPRATHSSQ
jgi:hypothetical protein